MGWGSIDDEPVLGPPPPSLPSDARGVYVPYRILRNPVPTRAYRFIFPELLVASQRFCTAHIWNVVTGEITEIYSLVSGLMYNPHPADPDEDEDEDGEELDGDGSRSINYVDFSPNHLFVCFGRKLVVYRRDLEQAKRTRRNEDLNSSLPPPSEWPEAERVLQLPDNTLHNPSRGHISQIRMDSRERPIVFYAELYPATMVSFTAVHVSDDGRDLAAVSFDGLLYYVQDFAHLGTAKKESVEKLEALNEGQELKGIRPKIWTMRTPSRMMNLVFDGKKIVFTSVSP